MRVTYLPQEAKLDAPHSIMAETMTAFAPLIALRMRMTELEHAMGEVQGEYLAQLMEEYADATHHFEVDGGYTMEPRAAQVLGGLGFPIEMFDTPVRQLSGGQKTRVALAKALLGEPDLLLLDEPTNHLDIASRDALQAVLAGFKGTLLFVSHDRYLIDALTEELWVIEDGALTRYAGNYSAYASGRAKLLDAKLDTVQRPGDPGGPETRVRRLEAEAAALAARLTAAGATTTVGNLAEMSDRYTQVMTDLQEAQAQWVDLVRAQLRSFSDSRDRSAAAKPL